MSPSSFISFPSGRAKRVALIVLTTFAVVVVGGVTVMTAIYVSDRRNTAGKVAFDEALPIPPLARSEMVDGTRVFRLDLRKGQTTFGHGLSSDTYFGQDGTPGAATNRSQYLAPTLRAARGERVRVTVTNDLGTTSSIHWHGMHLPATMDGGPHQPIAAGAVWAPQWQVRQPAATLWYHPHPHGATEHQVAKGLAGVFILDDPASNVAKRLPRTYGVDDIPVVLQGKAFDEGKPDTGHTFPFSTIGTLGDQVLANGKVGTFFTATTRLVRLRLVNASTARILNLGFTDNRSIRVIAGDGGLLEAPVSVKRLTLSPGDRLEVVVAVRPGDRTTLRSYPIHLAGFPFQRLSGGDDTLDVLQLRGARHLAASGPVPSHLADLPAVDTTKAVKRRSFVMELPKINGKKMDMKRIDFAVTGGTSEIWTVHNADPFPHNFHVHDVQYRVISLDGHAPPVEMQGRQDTVLIKGDQTVRIFISFSRDYADGRTPYMFHCHLLWHEDQGMMGQFVINPPGQQTHPRTMPPMAGMPGM